MPVEITKVTSKKDMKTFVRFANKLYKIHYFIMSKHSISTTLQYYQILVGLMKYLCPKM
jgi:hypothetical protein